MSRIIYLIGDIDEPAFQVFSEELAEFEAKSFNNPVEIELNSMGGTAMDALAFYARIRNSKCAINCTVYGLVASAAVLVLAGCEKRRMTAEAWMMVHEDEDSLRGASASHFQKHAKHMRRLEDQWNELMEKCTGTSKEKWAELHTATTYLSAEECKALGVVDEII